MTPWMDRAWCQEQPEWTSSRRDELAWAAKTCAGCPVWADCEQYAADIRATAGVYAGVDYSRCLTCGEDKKGRPLQQHCWECARDARAGRKAAAA